MKNFPVYEDLSEEQLEVVFLPLEGRYLVTGPPGSGKTVLALYRTTALTEPALTVTVLTFSKVLLGFLGPAVKNEEIRKQLGAVEMKTYDSWLGSHYQATFNQNYPRLGPWSPDWEAMLVMPTNDPPSASDALVIDEAQDLPKEFYFYIHKFIQNLTVFADENQRITETSSSLKEIRDGLLSERQLELKANYRNTRQIWELANVFYAGAETGMTDPPGRQGEKPVLIRTDGYKGAVRRIVDRQKTMPDGTVGVMLPTKNQVQSFTREIHQQLGPSAMRDRPVQSYVSGQGRGPDIDWDKPGIKVVTYQSAKGLECDVVVLPELQSFWGRPDDPEDRMMMFMLCSRARDHLELMYSGNGDPPMLRDVSLDLLST